jgi:ribosomal protein L7Ae-like RNA K-turn-binding protein
MSGLLGLIGLGYRGRGVVIGVDAIRRDLQGDRCACVVIAADASPRARDKVERLAAARGVPLITGPEAATIGAQLGKSVVMAVGVRDRALAEGMLRFRGQVQGGMVGVHDREGGLSG